MHTRRTFKINLTLLLEYEIEVRTSVWDYTESLGDAAYWNFVFLPELSLCFKMHINSRYMKS